MMIQTVSIPFLRIFSWLSGNFVAVFLISIFLSFIHPSLSLLYVVIASFFKNSKGRTIREDVKEKIQRKGLYVLIFSDNKQGFKHIFKNGIATIPTRDPIHSISRDFKPCVFLTIGKPTKTEIDHFLHLDVKRPSRKIFLLKILPKDITPELLERINYSVMNQMCTVDEELIIPAKVVSFKQKEISRSYKYYQYVLFTVTMSILKRMISKLIIAIIILSFFGYVVRNQHIAEFIINFPIITKVLDSKVQYYLGEDMFRFFL